MTEVVSIKSMDKVYGAGSSSFKALDNISLTINEGDFIGIMGPSGSGKSTLLNIIATIDTATRGKVLINGTAVENLYESELSKYRRENIGFIFQDCNLLDTLTLRDNILAPLTLANIPKEECDKRLAVVAKRMQIVELLDKYPAECSGGQRQRGAACRALVSNPKMIVADEPTGALDSKNSAELLSILKDLNEKDGITIVMVTHDSLIASYSKELLLIRDGKIDEILKRENKKQIDFYHEIVEETSKETNKLFEEDIDEDIEAENFISGVSQSNSEAAATENISN